MPKRRRVRPPWKRKRRKFVLKPSETLRKLALTDKRVEAYEWDGEHKRSNGQHWLLLEWPWAVGGVGSIHEWHVCEVLRELQSAAPTLRSE